MNASTHPVVPEELMAFLEGELSTERTQSVSAHIEQCAECHDAAASFRKTSHTLAAWTVAPVASNSQFESLLATLLPGAATQNASTKKRSLTWVPRGPSRLVAAFSVLFMIAGFVALISRTTYRMSYSKARQAALAEKNQRPIFTGTDTNMLAVAEQKGLAGPTDRFSRSDRAAPSSPISGREFTNLLSLSKASNSPSPGPPPPPPLQPMIARTVALSLVVKDFDASRKSLDAILVRRNGYAANLTVNTEQGAARSLTASLRIPAPQLAAAMNELKALGRVETESQNGEEVTQQHADLVARLKNSRETEQRLQAILLQRTGKISDVLEVEQEIARVRGEIEQMEAEQLNLEHRVDFAAIDLKFADEYKAQLGSPATSVSTQFHNALVNGYTSVADSLLGLLLSLIQYGPVLLLWIVILSSPAWVLWRRWKRASAAV
jgi:hypothetical protein